MLIIKKGKFTIGKVKRRLACIIDIGMHLLYNVI